MTADIHNISTDEGKLIYIIQRFSRNSCEYIASPKQGLVKFDMRAEVTELGLDHNSTIKFKTPLQFVLKGTGKLNIYEQKVKRICLENGTLVVKKCLKTNFGKLNCVQNLDVNDEGELIFTMSITPSKNSFCKSIDEGIIVSFLVENDYVESLNDKEDLVVMLDNSDENKIEHFLAIAGMRNVLDISVKSTESHSECCILADKIISKKAYLPLQFKVKTKRK